MPSEALGLYLVLYDHEDTMQNPQGHNSNVSGLCHKHTCDVLQLIGDDYVQFRVPLASYL